MWQAIGQLLPIALAAAVSSIPITATILILVSDRRDEAALPYLLGLVADRIELSDTSHLNGRLLGYTRMRT